ncbi:zinc uptake transcriptional regulator [Thermus tengchongensis]|uniref:Transcriptional repressor n=1 Tax=Thermus tengchongensis TaxID=1214928 RepID=A0A4Y9EZL6_9DEIN|nr:transcriptional repressor [Thermus tengchongensis]TFU18161.1 transcriptional repressor [Thermus tengchongensis]TFU27381.1 transcriptional repressor [Thermus tengchongensis]
MERSTRQRRAIREAFLEAGRPLSPQEVLELARKKVPSLGLATVYRTLKGLVEEGFLTPVALPGEPSRYEPAGREHHHHFLCRLCGRVFELSGCDLALEGHLPPGFQAEGHEVTVFGRCPECA